MASSQLPVLKNAILRSTVSVQSDSRLVEMVRAGVEPAFNTIVERYRSPLLRYASRMVDADRAEDVVQEALVKAHGSLLQDGREIQLKPWLYRITHNLALDAVRQKSWNYDQLDDNYDGVRQPPDYLEQKEQLRAVIERMDALPERQRRALILQAFEGRSSEEIARELDDGIPEARQLVHRARVRMRNAFGALIPLPLVMWLHKGTASAATASASGGKLLLGGALRTGFAKFATTTAMAVAIGASAGVVVGETAIRGNGVGTAEQVAEVGPYGDATDSASGARQTGGKKNSGSSADRSDSQDAAGRAPGGSGTSDGAGEGGANDGDHAPSGNADSTPAPGSEGGSSPSAGAPTQQPSGGGGGSTGGGSSGGGSAGDGSGGGSTGGGSTGDGSTGGGGGTGGGGSTDPGEDQTCIGPISQLPPICLPNLNGGGSGGGLPSLP